MERIGVSAQARALALFALTVGAAVVVTLTRSNPPWVDFALAATTLAAGIAGGALLVAGGRPARESQGPSPAALRRFQVDGRRGRLVVRAADVDWIEAAGNYARLHVDGDAHLYRMPLARLEERLDRGRFTRVHRSAIVNLDAVEEVRPRASGDADLRLRTGAAVRLSRRYAAGFHERTGRASA